MMATLQVMTYLPLTNVSYPTNALAFSTAIMDMASFKIFPVTALLDLIIRSARGETEPQTTFPTKI